MNSSSNIEKLDERNYESWKLQMRSVLVYNDLWGYASGIEKRPVNTAGDDDVQHKINLWDKYDEKALALILLALKENQLQFVKKSKTANEAWLVLEQVHRSRTPSRKIMLYKNLFQMQKTSSQTMTEHLKNFQINVDMMEEVGVELPKELVTIMLLNTLPQEYDNFCTAMESRDIMPDIEVLKVKLIDEESKRKGNDEDNESNQNAFYSTIKKNFPAGQDYKNKSISSNVGQSNGGKNKIKFDGNCYYCKKFGHKSSECRKKKKNQSKHVAMSAVSSFYAAEEDSWYVDSGASAHMCNNKNLFTDWTSREHQLIHIANGNTMDAYGTGTVELKLNETNSKIKLHDVIYSPNLRHNLISVSKATIFGMKITFNNKFAIFRNKKDECVVVANKIGNLYVVKTENSTSMIAQELGKSELIKWHERMGHLNFRDVFKLQSMVKGIEENFKYNKVQCIICDKAKITQLPFQNSVKYEDELLSTVHSDICGPFSVNSIGGARYFATFIDGKSRYVEVAFLKNKSDIFEAFKKYQKWAELKTGCKIKKFRTDNGREYISKEFNNYLSSHGIERQFTVEYTPQQNGVAERANRTLLDMARCMLLSSELPKSLWAEAINTAVFIRNRSPCSVLPEKTPFEFWFGKKPNVKYFRPFGCRVIALEKGPRRSKLDAKGKMYTFVGYCAESKGYRLWDGMKSVIKKRDVRFLEKVNPENYLFDEANFKLNPIQVESSEIKQKSHENEYDKDDPVKIESEVDIFYDTNIFEESDEETVQENHDANNEKDDDDEYLSSAISQLLNDDLDVNEKEFPVENNNNIVNLDETSSENKKRRGRPKIIRTGQRGRPRKLFIEESNYASIDPTSIVSLKSIMMRDDKLLWLEAMKKELESLEKNKTWKIVKRPENKKVLSNRWVFCVKTNLDGSSKYKARLVARGCEQTSGIDFNEIYAPVARYETIRVVFALCAELNLHLHQMDVVTAYVQGDLNEEVYMELPDLPSAKMNTSRVCQLQKPLYGLKQAARQWHKKLSDFLISLNMRQTNADQCLFIKQENNSIIMVLIYVDDLLIASNCLQNVNKMKELLSSKFEMKDMGVATNILGISIERESSTGSIEIHQRPYIEKLLEKFHMQNAKVVATPLDTSLNLTKIDESDKMNKNNEMQDKPYRELIGALSYLSNTVRPDIAFAVNLLSRYTNNPYFIHWNAAKRVLRYLKGTAEFSIKYRKTGKPFNCYVDADWAGDNLDRKSCFGYIVMLGGGPVCWKSKKQRCVALSTMEAEYIGLTEATKEVMYQKKLFHDLNLPFGNGKITIFCDNQSAIHLSKNPTHHDRSKHIDIKYHYCKQMQNENHIEVAFIPTNEMMADIFTKGLNKLKHNNCVKMMNL